MRAGQDPSFDFHETKTTQFEAFENPAGQPAASICISPVPAKSQRNAANSSRRTDSAGKNVCAMPRHCAQCVGTGLRCISDDIDPRPESYEGNFSGRNGPAVMLTLAQTARTRS